MGEAEPGVSQPLPLSGLRVLSVEQYGAGPYGTMFLAQLGAEVIKIEPPAGGDTSRAAGPYFLGPDDSLFFQTFNLNKRSLTLDLKAPEGKAIFHKLVATADAVCNNARGDQPAKLGLTYDALKHLNPSVVCAHLSAYGRGTPREAWPGYDYLMQAEAGFMSVTGEPDAPPTRFGLSIVDFMTGAMLAIGTQAAIIGARATGIGRDVDISLLDTALHQTSYPAYWYLNEGYVVGRAPRSAHPTVVPSQTFRTADGWVFVMAQQPKFWTLLTERLGRPDLCADPRFATVPLRLENRDALIAELDAIFITQPTQHWVDRLGGIVPVAPVNGLAQALDSPWQSAMGMVAAVDHPARPGMRVLANPIRVDEQRLPSRAAPSLGADTDELLAEMGLSEDEIERLRAAKVV
jgi:crotonobetainyl-CoA:carnitine CoA-transferase CaiB-like acyl-CoA transferase